MPSPTPINLFVTCTSTKRFLPTGNVMLREVNGSSVSERFSNWVARIQQSRSVPQPAVDTYSGGHWSVVRSMNESIEGTGGSARLWIVSAGYGLISPSDAIIPYGATFTPGQPDSVSDPSGASNAEASLAWWRILSPWRPPALTRESPRSIADVVSRHPQATNLLVLPPDYFGALLEDLRESLHRSADPGRLIILSSDGRLHAEFPNNSIKIDARLQTHLGGARSSLGVRTVRAVLGELEDRAINVESARQAFAGLLSRHGVAKIYDRTSVADGQVVQFVSDELSRNHSLSFTQGLRRFRDAGFACEMKRFRRLFSATRDLRTASLLAKNEAGY
jgi:hypothetical protein